MEDYAFSVFFSKKKKRETNIWNPVLVTFGRLSLWKLFLLSSIRLGWPKTVWDTHIILDLEHVGR